jgi:1-acyl-sn-glycerol-3-phosphate acyltransferase
MSQALRILFFGLVVRPLSLIVLGMNIRHRERLPSHGPAVIVGNHNSHLDTLVLMSLFPLRLLSKLRPVAAKDYFFKNKALAWFATEVIGIIPIDRHSRGVHDDPLGGVVEALGRNEIVIIFPEGSRGEPEQLGAFKTGVAHLANRAPELAFHPVFLHGLGKALPRGEALLVPFFCDIFVGEPLNWSGDKNGFMDELMQRMTALAAEGDFSPWE